MQRRLWPGELMQDVRISLRGLFRAPLMSMTIVATVGLGIGATTVIFSRRQCGAVAAASVRRAGPARSDLHRRPAKQVPFLCRRLSRVAGAADSVRTGCRVHRSSHGLQRRQCGRTTEGTSGVIHVLRAAWHPAGHRARLHATGWQTRQPAGGHREPRILATAAWRTPGRCRADSSGLTARTTRSPASFRRRQARWSSDRSSSSRRSGIHRGARGRFSSRCLDACGTNRRDRRPPANFGRSTGASFRCGSLPIRTRRRRGA